MSKPTFFSVARRAKWIGALVLALSVAAAFAGMAQWQADRTFRYVPKAPIDKPMIPLSQLAETSSPFLAPQADRLVSVEATPMPDQCYVVANRIQLDGNGGSKPGFWLVRPAITAEGKMVTLAFGWFATAEETKNLCTDIKESPQLTVLQTFRGLYEPSEEPQASEGSKFDSLSVEQIINQPGIPDPVDAFAGFVIVQKPEHLGEPILIGNNPGETVFNWLTAFYAAEWALFAGFAIFLWARLVKDEVNRENREGRID
jgi:cytochrome oxidase assembly protein ShyY1